MRIAGWLRDNDMLYVFPHQMHHGKDILIIRLISINRVLLVEFSLLVGQSETKANQIYHFIIF